MFFKFSLKPSLVDRIIHEDPIPNPAEGFKKFKETVKETRVEAVKFFKDVDRRTYQTIPYGKEIRKQQEKIF